MPGPYVQLSRARLFPREADPALPMQARLLARTLREPISSNQLQAFIAVGGLPPLDDPDAVNETYAQGW